MSLIAAGRHRERLRLAAALATLALLAALPAVRADDAAPFDAAARVLESRCLKCHGPAKRKGGLLLATREGILAGGDSGPAVAPGDAASRLLAAVSYADPDLEMPPTGCIAAAEINHHHIALTDCFGHLPKFSHWLHSIVARFLNAYYARFESFWAPGRVTNDTRSDPDLASRRPKELE